MPISVNISHNTVNNHQNIQRFPLIRLGRLDVGRVGENPGNDVGTFGDPREVRGRDLTIDYLPVKILWQIHTKYYRETQIVIFFCTLSTVAA